MAHDYEDVFDLDGLSDEELRAIVRDRLAAHSGVDVDDITVTVQDGAVRLAGRVGTEEEKRIALRVVTDEIGVRQVADELLVDPIRRGINPEATDDELEAEGQREGLLLGDRPVSFEPSTEHLADEVIDDDMAAGTTDVGKSIAFGIGWVPPERPTPEGIGGEETGRSDAGEDH